MQPLSYNIDHTRITKAGQDILLKKSYLACLLKKISYSRIGISQKTESEKNDVEIQSYETAIKISLVRKQIAEMECAFVDLLFRYKEEINTFLSEYDEVLAQAKKVQNEDIKLKHFLHEINWKEIDENYSKKYELYKSLKESL